MRLATSVGWVCMTRCGASSSTTRAKPARSYPNRTTSRVDGAVSACDDAPGRLRFPGRRSDGLCEDVGGNRKRGHGIGKAALQQPDALADFEHIGGDEDQAGDVVGRSDHPDDGAAGAVARQQHGPSTCSTKERIFAAPPAMLLWVTGGTSTAPAALQEIRDRRPGRSLAEGAVGENDGRVGQSGSSLVPGVDPGSERPRRQEVALVERICDSHQNDVDTQHIVLPWRVATQKA
ncbi:MAG: hypothetical protein JWP54_60 [Cryobacterium sp.]|jgi:hypothetical protein|nr:hypothetical protein [Cryobacterium sp.]